MFLLTASPIMLAHQLQLPSVEEERRSSEGQVGFVHQSSSQIVNPVTKKKTIVEVYVRAGMGGTSLSGNHTNRAIGSKFNVMRPWVWLWVWL